MGKQKLKGLWIPAEILLNADLSDKEKIVLSMILYLSDGTGSCFASNKYIASIVNVTSDRVSKIVSSLKDKEDFLVTDVEHKEQSRVIINNIKNKNNYNKELHIKKNNKANFEQRDYTGFDFTKLYANADAFL